MTRRAHLTVAVAGLAVALAGALSQHASAGPEDCNPCVIVVEVDGLEPQDVSQAKTPFLWDLGHSSTSSGGRNGFFWRKARGPMTAGTATATASLLTAGYSEHHDITADHFFTGTPEGDLGSPRLLGGHPAGAQEGAEITPIAFDDIDGDTLLAKVREERDDTVNTAAFVGNPGLSSLMLDASVAPEFPGQQGNPAYCSIPWKLEPPQGQPSNSVCMANDHATANVAAQELQSSTSKAVFSFIHLAELGAVKRQGGDVEAALQAMDSAVAQLVQRVANQNSATWGKTVLFVTGNHGYEVTPLAQRVPGEEGTYGDPTVPLLEDLVEGDSELQNAILAPQGTIGTVYAGEKNTGTTPDAQLAQQVAKRQKLEGLRQRILEVNDFPQCSDVADLASTGGEDPPVPVRGCIAEVLFTEPAPQTDPNESAEDRARRYENSLQGPTPESLEGMDVEGWHMDPVDSKTGKRTGAGGDLVVIARPGWAIGRAVPNPTDINGIITEPSELSAPYEASSGGPRNRDVALLVNGPSSVVKSGPADSAAIDPTAEVGFPASDEFPIPNTVDISATIAALMRVGIDDSQLGAERFLQEAFVRQLAFPNEDEPLDPPPPDDPPPPPPPPLAEPPPPPPPAPKGFDYTGLFRNPLARVVNRKRQPVKAAGPRDKLEYIELSADFGRPLTEVTLSFYRKVAGGARKRKKTKAKRSAKGSNLKVLARFDPFVIERGPAKLRLRVPDQFKPTHIGIFVREARRTTASGAAVKTKKKKAPKVNRKTVEPRPNSGGDQTPEEQKQAEEQQKQRNWRTFGSATGAIVRILDSAHLNKRKCEAGKRPRCKKKARSKTGK